MQIALLDGITEKEMIVKVVHHGREFSIRFAKPHAGDSWYPVSACEFETPNDDMHLQEISESFLK